jgi:2-polyprenyl-3-methyl-5-hydroxy-6-metoxy-1,4-benzoquinol methylase
MTDKPIALDAYETLADSYASVIDTKPHNAYYERPATLSLLPEVTGKRVLDAGCGPGVYSQWLIEHGADVVAVDASTRMIELTKQRLKRTTDIWQADLSKPLTFLESSSFDVVMSPLVLNYIQDWSVTLGEFYRLLVPEGTLVFSVSHPFFDYTYFNSQNYFATELVGSTWQGFPNVQVHMPSFRRSLADTLNPVIEAGFRLEKILEPKPTKDFKEADPEDYEELMRQPVFLCIRARKP